MCPVYDGPVVDAGPRALGPLDAAEGDVPAARGELWPVRTPGAIDGQLVVLIVLGALSIVILGVAVVLSLAALNGRVAPTGSWVVILVAGAVSLTTHLLTLLRLWVRG
jgi:hypothetical protein